ncbi:MAG: bacteriohemerythrin [Bacillota bacterium]
MAIEWKDDLAIGVLEVDNQHKELFKKVSDLFEACTAGKGKEEISQVVSYLEDYVVVHFRDEEGLQAKYSYPEFESHKKQHEQFIKDFIALKEKLQFEGPTATVIIQLNHTLVNWLINHIRKTDKALGAFLREKGIV